MELLATQRNSASTASTATALLTEKMLRQRMIWSLGILVLLEFLGPNHQPGHLFCLPNFGCFLFFLGTVWLLFGALIFGKVCER